MSTEAPAAPVKTAPVTPSAPAKPASVAPVAPATTTPATPPKPAPSLDDGLKSLAAKTFVEKPAAEPPAKPAEPAPKAESKPEHAGAAEPVKAEPVSGDVDMFAHVKQPDLKTEDGKAGWRALKTEAAAKVRDAEKRYSEAMAQLETYKKATPADTAEAARLKDELKKAQDALAVHDLKAHPDFAKQYLEPKKAALKEAGEIVTYNNKEGVNLNAILDKPLKEFNAEVSELTKDMNGMDATTVQTALRQAYKIANEEKAALGKASELKQQLESKAAAAARQAFEETRGEFASKVPEIQIPEGASEEKAQEIRAYNEARAAAMKKAEHYSFGKIGEREVARIAQQAAALEVVAGHLIPSLTRERDQAVALNKQLSAELEAIKKGKTPGKFTGPSGAPERPDITKLPIDQGLKALSKQILGG